jgi:hypothetical protein
MPDRGEIKMAFYIINTDRQARNDVRTCDLWFQHGMAFAGDEDTQQKHTGIFRRLHPGDTLFMWHSNSGCVGVGAVLEGWDQQTYTGDDRLLYVKEPYEYRIRVRWIQDWRQAPRGYQHGLPVPRGGTWQQVDPEAFPLVHLYSCGSTIPTRAEHDGRLQKAVAQANSDADGVRAKRLEAANPFPKATLVLTPVFDRNPDVIIEVLRRANGTCEDCKTPAPFNRRSDGSPYLEVHHITTLASGGEDTVKNAQALCPNCHRKAHYGE